MMRTNNLVKTLLTSWLFMLSLLVSANVQAQSWCWEWRPECMGAINANNNTDNNSNSNANDSYYTPSYSPPPKASQYGAVAWDLKRSIWGYSVMQPTQRAANIEAVAVCGLKTCKVTAEFANTWVAMSFGRTSKSGFSSVQGGLSQAEAEQKAIDKCEASSENCQIILSESSLP